MTDPDTLDLNKYLQAGSYNPVGLNTHFTTGMEFETQYEIQARFARLSRNNIKNMVQNSGVSAASGTFGSGQTLNLQTILTNNVPHQADNGLALPYIACYQGTAAVGSLQIYPRLGAGIASGVYHAGGGFDYEAYINNSGTFPATQLGTYSTWGGFVENVSAGNQSLYFVSIWKTLQYNSGTQS